MEYTENDIFRMERTVMSKENIDVLKEASEDRVAESILQYICYEHQYNIFGYGTLDPEEFGRKFGFGRTYLSTKHEHPFQDKFPNMSKELMRPDYRFRDGKIIEDFSCETRLENAFFVLGNCPLYSCTSTVTDDRKLIRTFRFHRILESFSIIQDEKTGKVLFAYRLDKSFRRNLASLYQNASLNSAIALRQSGLGALYYHLLRLRDGLYSLGQTSTTQENTPTFDYLCSLADIRTNQDLKYRKRDLNAALRKVKDSTELDFDVEWVRGIADERYTPLFHFNPTIGEQVLLSKGRAGAVRERDERVSVAVCELKHLLYEEYPVGPYPVIRDAEALFFSWLKRKMDNPEFRVTLGRLIAETYLNLSCAIPPDIGDRADVFFDNLGKYGEVDFDLWLRDVFYGEFKPVVPEVRKEKKKKGG